MMKHPLTSLRLAMTYAGCFLGAGYVSGRELWQFFGRWGSFGWLGLVLAMLALALLGSVTLWLAGRMETDRVELLVFPRSGLGPRLAVSVFSIVFLFGFVSIMTAGVGALFEQLWGLPRLWISLAFALVVALFTLTGLEGMVQAFSLLVPILTATAAALSLGALALLPASETAAPAASGGGWLFSALAFAAYNMFGSVAILAPLGRAADRRVLRRGVALGTGLLLALALLFLLVLRRRPETAALELPMLEAARLLSPGLAQVFALLLLLAMFGTAFSCFLTGVRQLADWLPPVRDHRALSIFLLAALLWSGSLFGFGKLIDTVYPAFGAVSLVFLGLMVINAWEKRRTDRN